MNDPGFLSKNITVSDLLQVHGDVHHIYPKDHLKKIGLARGKYNQIANLVRTQTEINIAIGGKDPSVYFAQIAEQARTGEPRYGAIADMESMRDNLRRSCVPVELLDDVVMPFDEFLDRRRLLMAAKLRDWFTLL
jgi:hypothetical protein